LLDENLKYAIKKSRKLKEKDMDIKEVSFANI